MRRSSGSLAPAYVWTVRHAPDLPRMPPSVQRGLAPGQRPHQARSPVGGVVVFFAHVGRFIFGVITARVLMRGEPSSRTTTPSSARQPEAHAARGDSVERRDPALGRAGADPSCRPDAVRPRPRPRPRRRRAARRSACHYQSTSGREASVWSASGWVPVWSTRNLKPCLVVHSRAPSSRRWTRQPPWVLTRWL